MKEPRHGPQGKTNSLPYVKKKGRKELREGGKEEKSLSWLYITQISQPKSYSPLIQHVTESHVGDEWVRRQQPYSGRYYRKQTTVPLMVECYDAKWFVRVKWAQLKCLLIFIKHIWELLSFVCHFLTLCITTIPPLSEIVHAFFFWNFPNFFSF